MPDYLEKDIIESHILKKLLNENLKMLYSLYLFSSTIHKCNPKKVCNLQRNEVLHACSILNNSHSTSGNLLLFSILKKHPKKKSVLKV